MRTRLVVLCLAVLGFAVPASADNPYFPSGELTLQEVADGTIYGNPLGGFGIPEAEVGPIITDSLANSAWTEAETTGGYFSSLRNEDAALENLARVNKYYAAQFRRGVQQFVLAQLSDIVDQLRQDVQTWKSQGLTLDDDDVRLQVVEYLKEILYRAIIFKQLSAGYFDNYLLQICQGARPPPYCINLD